MEKIQKESGWHRLKSYCLFRLLNDKQFCCLLFLLSFFQNEYTAQSTAENMNSVTVWHQQEQAAFGSVTATVWDQLSNLAAPHHHDSASSSAEKQGYVNDMCQL